MASSTGIQVTMRAEVQVTGAAGARSKVEMIEMFAAALHADHLFGCTCEKCKGETTDAEK